jgi:hypothetical protein
MVGVPELVLSPLTLTEPKWYRCTILKRNHSNYAANQKNIGYMNRWYVQSRTQYIAPLQGSLK